MATWKLLFVFILIGKGTTWIDEGLGEGEHLGQSQARVGGDIQEFIDELQLAENAEKLKEGSTVDG